MNWDQIEGKWKQFQGKAQEKWGKLTDDDFDKIAGKRDQLVGKVQESYGIAKDAAELLLVRVELVVVAAKGGRVATQIEEPARPQVLLERRAHAQ